MYTKTRNFFQKDIWQVYLRDLPPIKGFLLKQLKVFILAIRGFKEDHVPLRAYALTMYTLLSIVPVLALAFGMAKGFGYETLLREQLLEQIPEQETMLQQVIDFAQSLLERAEGGLIAGIGVIVLFWSVINVLGNIEKSFNEIWGIKKNRSIGRKFSDYLSLMVIFPILMLLSSSSAVFIRTRITALAEAEVFAGIGETIIFFLLKLIPYVITWILFTFMYIFLPNTKVKFKSGLWAGILIGTLYQVVQWTYITLQVGVAKYNAIYGSFAAIPLFIIWLQLSWLIVLLGAEISFFHHNFESYEHEYDSSKISFSSKKLICLQIVTLIVNAFIKNESPLTIPDITQKLEIPRRLLQQLLYDLQTAGIIAEVKTEDNEDIAYQPAKDPHQLTIGSVVTSLEKIGLNEMLLPKSATLEQFTKSLEGFERAILRSQSNKKIIDFAEN